MSLTTQDLKTLLEVQREAFERGRKQGLAEAAEIVLDMGFDGIWAAIREHAAKEAKP